ncbi:hypothetical protein [Marinobacterium sp. BA1]|uniref:hypothetical protein n=1 Tax=Marinobacterium sp. BA1 TaxID=3138931 RepID=UPI0032E534FC
MDIASIRASSLEDPLYYLRNAEQVIRLCLSRYADLISPDETRRLTRLLSLDESPRALLIRLVMRKGTLFRPAIQRGARSQRRYSKSDGRGTGGCKPQSVAGCTVRFEPA